ncbi:MAG: hypothetical protein JSS63_12115 [Bacteroidetes bacterium]|nr:hypothetical protein [Bacteroidota bacterium]
MIKRQSNDDEILYLMKSQKLSRNEFNLIEDVEKKAWDDMFLAMPEDFKDEFGFDCKFTDNLTLVSSKKIPFGHFNAVLGLGFPEAADEAALETALEYFKEKGIGYFYVHWAPGCIPENFESVLKRNGLEVTSGWDRIVRFDEPYRVKISSERKFEVEKVNAVNAGEWAAFIDGIYGMPTTQWLLALCGRDGWHHYMLKEDGVIKAVRTAYINGGTAWLGIDAPVPGIMTQDFEPDYILSAKITEDCLKKGAGMIVTVIEKPSMVQDSKAYYYWDKLGFKIAYYRKNYCPKK